MMSRLMSSNTQTGLLLRLLVCSLAASLQLAHASRALQENSCVVLGSSSLRNCNNPSCNCEGKSRDGNSCRCSGECDPTYRNCDGNQNNQASCDCSGTPLLGAGVKAVENTAAAVAGSNPPPAPTPAPAPAPAPKPKPPPAPKPAPAPAPAQASTQQTTQVTQTPGVYQFGSGGMTPGQAGVIPIGGGVIPIGGGGFGQPVGFGIGR